MSTTNFISKTLGVTNTWLEAAAPTALGVESVLNTQINDNNAIPPFLYDYIAYYAIAKGILQMAEAADMKWGNEKSPDMAKWQFFAGMASAIVGLAYEFTGTSVILLSLGLGVNALVRALTLWQRAPVIRPQLLNVQVLGDHMFSPVSNFEFAIGSPTNVWEAMGYFALALNCPLLWTIGVSTKSAFFLPALEKTYNAITKPSKRSLAEEPVLPEQRRFQRGGRDI